MLLIYLAELSRFTNLYKSVCTLVYSLICFMWNSGIALLISDICYLSTNFAFSYFCFHLFLFFLLKDQPPKRSGEPEKDPGCKSEGEDDSQAGTSSKKSLGRTPNHLTLR